MKNFSLFPFMLFVAGCGQYLHGNEFTYTPPKRTFFNQEFGGSGGSIMKNKKPSRIDTEVKNEIKINYLSLKYQIIEDGENAKKYKIIPELFSKNKNVLVIVEWLNGNRTVEEGLLINGEGELVSADESGMPFVLDLQGMAKGEPATVFLISSDRSLAAKGEIIPNPLYISDSLGHVLGLEIINSEKTKFRFYGLGFSPGSRVAVQSTKGRKVLTTKFSTTKQGTFSGVISPAEQGGKGGHSVIEVRNKDAHLKLEYDWGNSL